MATLTIRKLDDKVHARLRVQAAINGRSVEEEVREVLASATHPKRKPGRKKVMGALEKLRASIRKANRPASTSFADARLRTPRPGCCTANGSCCTPRKPEPTDGPRMLTKFGSSKFGSPNSRLTQEPKLGCLSVPEGE